MRKLIACNINAIDKVVISDNLTSEETEPWHNTRIIRRADAHEQIGRWDDSDNVLVRYEVGPENV